MIGKMYWAIFKFYNISKHRMAFKKRPVLIIGEADQKDYVYYLFQGSLRKNIWI